MRELSAANSEKLHATNDIHICLATDESYAPYCGVVISSIIKNRASGERLYFYIINQNLGAESKEKFKALSVAEICDVQIVDTSPEAFRDAPIADGFHFRTETYFRFLIPQLLAHLDRVLYLDCDILVRASLAGLFSADMQGNLLGMAKGKDTRKHEGYFNAGVILIDCAKWRTENTTAKIIDFMRANKDQINHDQHLINLTLHDEIYEIDQKWNRTIYLGVPDGDKTAESDVILHYPSHVKPWHGVCQNELTDEYFDYLNRIPWDIEDNRARNKDINPARYYNGRLTFLYLLAKGFVSVQSELTLLTEVGSKNELVYAASDLGFTRIRETRLEDIPSRLSEDIRIVAESEFDHEIKDTLEHSGYQNGVHYSFLRTISTGQIEKTLDKAVKSHQDQTGKEPEIIIYGTAVWAAKCTEIAVRNNMDIVSYVDSDTKKWGAAFYRKKIISPVKLGKIINDNTLILIASSAVDEIGQTLLKQGINKKQIVTFDVMRRME